MGIASRLAAFAVVLIVAFGAAFGLGRGAGPVDRSTPTPSHAPGASHPVPDHDSNDHDSNDHDDQGGGS